jgi:hypothetical protein
MDWLEAGSFFFYFDWVCLRFSMVYELGPRRCCYDNR